MFVAPLSDYTVHKILLRPNVEMAQSRNTHRTNKSYDTSGLVEIIGRVHEMMPPTVYARAGWTIIDNTHLSLEETVDAILSQI